MVMIVKDNKAKLIPLTKTMATDKTGDIGGIGLLHHIRIPVLGIYLTVELEDGNVNKPIITRGYHLHRTVIRVGEDSILAGSGVDDDAGLDGITKVLHHLLMDIEVLKAGLQATTGMVMDEPHLLRLQFTESNKGFL